MTTQTTALSGGAFGTALAQIRQQRRPYLSQSRLGDAAGFDHSYVSRLETGTRQPTRVAVLALASALQATPDERDALLLAGGFAAVGVVETDPLLDDVRAILADTRLSEAVRAVLRGTLISAVYLAAQTIPEAA